MFYSFQTAKWKNTKKSKQLDYRIDLCRHIVEYFEVVAMKREHKVKLTLGGFMEKYVELLLEMWEGSSKSWLQHCQDEYEVYQKSFYEETRE